MSKRENHDSSDFYARFAAPEVDTTERPAGPEADRALDRIVHIGEGPLAANVMFGRILFAHVSDGVIGAEGRPDAAKLDLIGRLGGDAYVRTRDIFSMERP